MIPGRRRWLVRAVIFAAFGVFGIIQGVLAARFDRQYDQWFPFDVPGDLMSIPLRDGPGLAASVSAWVIIGAALTLLFRPKVIAWIMGVYVVVFGGLWLRWEAMHW